LAVAPAATAPETAGTSTVTATTPDGAAAPAIVTLTVS
jgi:hypothetical protein